MTISRSIQRTIVLLFITILTLHPFLLPLAVAEECSGDTCIDVSADANDQVLIRVTKGAPGSSSTSQGRDSRRPYIKKPWIPWLPERLNKPRIPRPSSSPRSSARPRTKKIAATSIEDQVRSLIPSGAILTQPFSNPLVREPVNFLTTVPNTFRTVVIILDIPITLNLRATYFWDFGDGESAFTHNAGAPYPISTITHSYQAPGNQKVALTVRWSGTWSAGPIIAPIRGEITQRFFREITIHPAATRLTR